MFNKLKQFNDLRKQANQLKTVLAAETVTVEKNSLTVVMDGNQEVKSLTINPTYLSADKKDQIERETKEAINEAIKKVQRVMAEKMRSMGGFNIPGMGGDNS